MRQQGKSVAEEIRDEVDEKLQADFLREAMNRMLINRITPKQHRVGPGNYSHMMLHKQISESRYSGADLRAIRRDPNKR